MTEEKNLRQAFFHKKIYKCGIIWDNMPKVIRTNHTSKLEKHTKSNHKIIDSPDLMEFEKKINALSKEDLKDLLLVNTYKIAMTRAQIEAIMNILIKKGITSYDEVWKNTNEIFKETKKE